MGLLWNITWLLFFFFVPSPAEDSTIRQVITIGKYETLFSAPNKSPLVSLSQYYDPQSTQNPTPSTETGTWSSIGGGLFSLGKVNTVAVRQRTVSSGVRTQIIYGGSFLWVEGVNYTSICLYDQDLNYWTSLGSSFIGTVYTLSYSEKEDLLFVGGNITQIPCSGSTSCGGAKSQIAHNFVSYSFQDQTWTDLAPTIENPECITSISLVPKDQKLDDDNSRTLR